MRARVIYFSSFIYSSFQTICTQPTGYTQSKISVFKIMIRKPNRHTEIYFKRITWFNHLPLTTPDMILCEVKSDPLYSLVATPIFFFLTLTHKSPYIMQNKKCGNEMLLYFSAIQPRKSQASEMRLSQLKR